MKTTGIPEIDRREFQFSCILFFILSLEIPSSQDRNSKMVPEVQISVKTSHFQNLRNSFRCQTLYIHHSTQESSNIQLYEQEEKNTYLTGGETLIRPSLTVGASCIAIHRCPQWFGVVPRLCSPLASSGCLLERQLSGWQSGKTQWCKPEGREKLRELKEDKQSSFYSI